MGKLVEVTYSCFFGVISVLGLSNSLKLVDKKTQIIAACKENEHCLFKFSFQPFKQK